MKKHNILSLTLAGILVIGALSACSGNSAAPASSAPAPAASSPAASAPAASPSASLAAPAPAPAEGASGKIMIATENETPSMTVAQHNAVAGSYMNDLTHNGLYRTSTLDLSPVPDLAESYENPSDLEWVFHLKKGVKFHNGEEMTAHDVKASLEYVQQFPESAMNYKNIQKVEALDDYTLKITTPVVAATLLEDLTAHVNYIMPKSLIDSGNDFNANPIGTGAYAFTNWTFGDSLSFVAFDDYFDTERAPKIKDMTWRIIPEGSSRTIALEAGEVDLVVEVATQDIPRMEANPAITVLMKPGTSHNFMMINNELPQFSNIAVRKALDMAIDKEAVIGVALDGLALPVYTQVPMGFAGTSEEGVNHYDPEGAKALLAEAGIDPSTIKFDIICSNDQKRRCGEVIQSNLKEIGIDVTLSSMDLATYLSQTAEGNYEAAIGGYTSSSLIYYLQGVWHSASINASNKTRLVNPELDALIDKAAATVDEAARVAILEQATKLTNELTGQVPIYQATVQRAFNSKLQVPELGASGGLPFNMVYWAD